MLLTVNVIIVFREFIQNYVHIKGNMGNYQLYWDFWKYFYPLGIPDINEMDSLISQLFIMLI